MVYPGAPRGFPTVPSQGWSVNIHPMRSMAPIAATVSIEGEDASAEPSVRPFEARRATKSTNGPNHRAYRRNTGHLEAVCEG